MRLLTVSAWPSMQVGVHLEQDSDAVPGTAADLGSGHHGVQPPPNDRRHLCPARFTYVDTASGFVYATFVTDLFSHDPFVASGDVLGPYGLYYYQRV
jgi:hypothetical protein